MSHTSLAPLLEPKPGEKIRALGMLSGGLDSTLAARVLMAQGIEVLGVNFYTGFCVTEQQRRVGRVKPGRKARRNEALRTGAQLEIPVDIVDIAEPYKEVVLHPKYGYGANMNPCVDCRIFMMQNARQAMIEKGAHFLFTGEVLGQRPKSQHRVQLDVVARQSGLEGYLLRPLSAKCLPPSIPEQRGWVDRDQLEGIQGRSRKRQMELARNFGIDEYSQPAGGCCYLADPNYSKRFQDLLGHRPDRSYDAEDAILLGLGRHFRLSSQVKLVVGRDENENNVLETMRQDRPLLRPLATMGPMALWDGPLEEELVDTAARIVARYSDGKDGQSRSVEFQGPHEGPRAMKVLPLDESALDQLRI